MNLYIYVILFFSVKVKKVKNITRTALGDKIGRIHMKKQNLDQMGGKRVPVLRNSSKKSGRDSDSPNARSSKRSRDDSRNNGKGSSKKPRNR